MPLRMPNVGSRMPPRAGAALMPLFHYKALSTTGENLDGQMEAASADEGYCTQARTMHIKTELARHLAGDYVPGAAFKDPNAEDDGGLFSGSGGLFDPKSDGTTFKQASPVNNY